MIETASSEDVEMEQVTPVSIEDLTLAHGCFLVYWFCDCSHVMLKYLTFYLLGCASNTCFVIVEAVLLINYYIKLEPQKCG